MNTVKMYVMRDIEEYRKRINMPYAKLAEKLMKDAAVIKRQLTEVKGGVQLNTAYELANAVGGVVKFIPSDVAEDVTISERAELNRQINMLMETVKAQEAEIEKQSSTIISLQTRLMANYDRLEKKDEVIHQLLKEKGVIEK